jgi:hypothetical protein
MRYRYGCMALTVALTLALTSGATRVASADPPPLAQAEAAIAVENCGLPLVAASADPPPQAQTEAAIWADNCRSSLERTLGTDRGPRTLAATVRRHPKP